MSLKRRLIRGGAWVFGGKLISILSAFVLNLLLTRNLKPADYAAYFVCFNTVIILVTVATFGMDQIAVRMIAVTTAAGRFVLARRIVLRCLGIVAVGGLLMVAVLAAGSNWLFATQLKMPQIVPVTGIVLCWLLAASLQRQIAETFRGFGDIRLATMFGGLRNNGFLINAAICFTVGGFALAHALSLERVFAILAACSGLVVLLSLALLARKIRRREDVAMPETATPMAISARPAYLLHESWPLWISMLVTVLNNQGVGWLAAKFDVPSRVALFGLAQQFAVMAITPAIMGNSVMPPIIAELYSRREMGRLERVAQTVAGLVSIPSAGIFLLLLFAGQDLLGKIFGSYYQAAYPLLLIMCAGQVVNVATGSWQVVLPMVGQKNQMLLLSLFSATLQAVVGVLAGRHWGVYGVAWAFCLSMTLTNLAGMVVVHRRLGVWTYVWVDRKVIVELFAMVKNRLAGGRSAKGDVGVATAEAAPGSKGSA
ncbi:MAG TPA: lipopolysaccharide biosynthesis protein [Xanthomonadaceae bacterium]|jgi:O-antigen/teichoic acid export membrane protein